MEQQEKEYLLIEEIYSPIHDEELKKLQPIINDFVSSYEQNQDRPIEQWLTQKLQTELPDTDQEEIQTMSKDIIESVQTFEANKKSLSETLAMGGSKESWAAKRIQEAVARQTIEGQINYLQELDNAVNTANEALKRTIVTKAGIINQNPSLNGFIAEQEHVQSFNMNAAACKSEFRAKVLEPNGQSYAKNSVDIVIVDGKGKAVKRYQSKYCKDAEATQKAFENGDYRGQQSLAPSDQVGSMTRKATDRIEAPDGTASNPLTKEQAIQRQEEARSGKWNDKNWNDYKAKDIAIGASKQIGKATLLSAVINAGFEIAEKIWTQKKIDKRQVAKAAIEGGADSGVKAALTAAVKVGSEKGIIACIPKGTSSTIIGNVVCVAVENAKILYKYDKGKITGSQALEQMSETTIAATCGLLAMKYGASAGTAIGSVFGPVGSIIGGFVGGSLGYLAGSKYGKAMLNAHRAIASEAYRAVKPIVQKTISKVSNTIKHTIRSAVNWLIS